jgi:hypothetical protein
MGTHYFLNIVHIDCPKHRPESRNYNNKNKAVDRKALFPRHILSTKDLGKESSRHIKLDSTFHQESRLVLASHCL